MRIVLDGAGLASGQRLRPVASWFGLSAWGGLAGPPHRFAGTMSRRRRAAPTTTAAVTMFQRRQPSNRMAPPRDIGVKRASATLPASGPPDRRAAEGGVRSMAIINGRQQQQHAQRHQPRRRDLRARRQRHPDRARRRRRARGRGRRRRRAVRRRRVRLCELSQLGQRRRHRPGQLRFRLGRSTPTAITSTASRA